MSFGSTVRPLCAALLLLCSTAGAQPDAGDAEIPRTPWGAPDLEGVWDFRTITPFERPAELAGKEFLSRQEAAEWAREAVERRHKDNRDGGAAADVERAYNHFWWDYGTNAVETGRTSLIIDPPDGRLPALTPAGERRREEQLRAYRQPPAGPEDMGNAARCMVGFNAGPPLRPSAYNNNLRIVQTEDYVALHTEMAHDTRIVPLDGRPHLPAEIRHWLGDARGRWEGDTLVVESRHFTDKTSFRGSGPEMRLTERFRRIGERGLLYTYTVEDPDSFERPFTVEVPMRPLGDRIYEYACHEGNHSAIGILAGARFQETSELASDDSRR